MARHSDSIRRQQRPSVTTFRLIAAVALATYGSAVAFETQIIFDSSSVLPSELRQSVHHRVRDSIRVEHGYFIFDIESNFGTYSVRSLGMLRTRVHEVNTMGQALAQFQYSDEDLRRSIRGKRGVASESVVDLLTRPVETVEQLATNLSSNLEQTLEGDYGSGWRRNQLKLPSPTGSPSPQRRSAASQLNLDVYSSNPDVQRFLDKVEEARTEGRTRSAMATISQNEPEPVIAGTLFRARLRKLLKNESPDSIERYNRTYLSRMGIEPSLVKDFLSHSAYSPRNISLIVAYLRLLDEIPSRTAIIQNALRARTETDAVAERYRVRMLVHYHRTVAKLDVISAEVAGLIAVTNNGVRVLFNPADLIQWNAQTADAVVELALFPTASAETALELVMAGTASKQARSRFTAQGLSLREQFSFD